MSGYVVTWIAGLFVLGGAGPADSRHDSVVFSQQRVFRIPLAITDPDRRGNKSVRLYVSSDHGKSWQQYDEVAPDLESIVFRAEREGVYWLTVALVDESGRQTPESLANVEPGLSIIVDRQAPKLSLKPIKTTQGHRGVKWELSDEHLDPTSFRLAVWEKSTGWKSHPVGETGQRMVWFEEGRTYEKIQATVKDRAGNQAFEQVDVIGDQYTRSVPTGFAIDQPQNDAVASVRAQPAAEPIQSVSHVASGSPALSVSPSAASSETMKTQTLNSLRISVEYEIHGVGPSGVGAVTLWGTKDGGHTWTKLATDADKLSPVEAELPQDGVWGLVVVVSSGADPRERAPEAGLAPEIGVEVDTTAPMVSFTGIEVRDGEVVIRWSIAEPGRLPNTPVSLFAAPDRSGPWHAIAEKIEHTGEYVWRYAAAGMSGRYCFRIEVCDDAGNVGAAASTDLYVLDASRPRGRVTAVKPVSPSRP